MAKMKPIKSAKQYKEACKKMAQLEKLIEKKTAQYNKQLMELEELSELIAEYEEEEM